MRSISDAANTPAAPGGNYESLIPRAGRLSAGDSAEDLNRLQDALKQLSSEKGGLLQKLFAEYREKRSQGVSQDHALSELESKLRMELEASMPSVEGWALNKLVGAMEGGGSAAMSLAFYIMSAITELDISGGEGISGVNLGSGDFDALVQWVMMEASKKADEDLKSMMEEVKKQNEKKARARRTAAAGAGAGLLLLIGLIFGPRLFPSGDAASDPPEVYANLPAVQVPGANAVGPIGVAPGCKIALMSPASAVDLPISGPVNVQWTSDPPGASYALEVLPPEGEPWLIPTDGNSKNVFMENFPAGGTYEFTVSTLDASGAVLCSAVVSFQKPAYDEAAAKREAGDGAYCDPNGIFGC